MPTPLQNLQAAYRDVCAKIAEVLANPLPDYTLPGGVRVDRKTYYESLLDQEKSLRAIPGAAPDTNPVFTQTSIVR
ncbi:hypothetical protein GobsT_12170 [Gemmata obscuriglobus]|uniref:Uncharacterized protein n=1 Tax=Gemmata obscuriglobus TaxID=114 RepID=A0A2Z3HEY1_9BACT|nr:hypothetical protein [Gemmata obscuriglobus]AWM40314.1 hypothetical protein C1280_27125 [Gemmata obscuriglobus]QEG26477.1 hypothetical protein GobsT_12170 [Gemmata obscuriglobus]VTS01719.1 unnamed protein product [Gemmata obscuriglobus UQM 2246]